MERLRRYYHNVRDHKKTWRFLLSRFLWYSRLCLLLTIRKPQYRLKFFPTAFSASLWVDPNARIDDEQFLMATLRPKDIVVDAGANIGALTLLAAALVGPQGKVFAFEPHPRIFGYLRSNVTLNSFTSVECFNLALGDRLGTISFSDQYSDDQNRVCLETDNRHVKSVPIKRLDDVLLQHLPPEARIALIKVDVEGFEKFVLEGAASLMDRCDAIFFESFEENFQHYGYSTIDLLNFLIAKGFTIHRRVSGRLQAVNPPYVSIQCENLLAFRSRPSDGSKKSTG